MHEFYHVSEMMRDDKETFQKFVLDMYSKKELFLNLISSFGEEYTSNGVRLDFYELDGDNYGYEVAKWGVNFESSDSNSLIFRGYSIQTIYDLINKENNEVEFTGDDYEITMYVNEGKFKEMTQEELDDMYTSKDYEFDKCKEWVKELIDVPMEFQPDRNY